MARTMLVLLMTLSAASAYELEGDVVEGGLLVGRAEPGTRVMLDETDVPVSADGAFVIGFHRDSPEMMLLRIEEPGKDTVRQELHVRQREYEEQRIDNLDPKRVTPPAEMLARIRDEAQRVQEARSAVVDTPFHAEGFVWPVEGCVTGRYGTRRILNGEPRQPHFGVDIAAPSGESVLAPAAGVVVLAEPDLYFSGGTIVIAHGQGLTSSYLHLSSLAVAVGDEVVRGDVVGHVGSTGRSTGPHLDWRFNWLASRLDPELVAGPASSKCG